MRTKIGAIALTAMLVACGSSAGTPRTSVDAAAQASSPPQPHRVESSRETSQGLARVRLSLKSSHMVGSQEQVSFRIDNGGEVSVSVDEGFTLERWEGESWVRVEGAPQTTPTAARDLLRPGESSEVQRWPERQREGGPEPGWYRIVKTAWTEAERELRVHGRFQVRADNWSAPPEDQDEEIVRRETPRGVAAAELLVEPREVAPDGRVSIWLVNRGRVALNTGYGFEVDRWDGRTWVSVPHPEKTLIPDVLIPLRPGQGTHSKMQGPERWTGEHLDGESMKPGWYRVAKSARIEGRDGQEASAELVARALFHVVP